MTSDIIAIITVLVGGMVILGISKISRVNYDTKFGKSTYKTRLRFLGCFLTIFSVMSVIMYFYQELLIIIFGAGVLISFTGLPENPGLKKDVIYSCVICSLIVGAGGIAYHSM